MSKLYGLKFKGPNSATEFATHNNKRVEIYRGNTFMFKEPVELSDHILEYYAQFKGLQLITTVDGQVENEDKKGKKSKTKTPFELEQEAINEKNKKEVVDAMNKTTEQKEEDAKVEQVKEDLTDKATGTIDKDEVNKFLDLNYDDESIKVLAKEIGVSFRESATKSTIISKILNSDEYLNKVMAKM